MLTALLALVVVRAENLKVSQMKGVGLFVCLFLFVVDVVLGFFLILSSEELKLCTLLLECEDWKECKSLI